MWVAAIDSPAEAVWPRERNPNPYTQLRPYMLLMETVLVPVRYPLSQHSRATLSRAIEMQDERDGELIILHVNLYQNGRQITRSELKRAVEREFGRLPRARYTVRRGFLVEEGILEEIADERADVAVIGHKQQGRLERALRRLRSDPDIAQFLKKRVDCEIEVV